MCSHSTRAITRDLARSTVATVTAVDNWTTRRSAGRHAVTNSLPFTYSFNARNPEYSGESWTRLLKIKIPRKIHISWWRCRVHVDECTSTHNGSSWNRSILFFISSRWMGWGALVDMPRWPLPRFIPVISIGHGVIIWLHYTADFSLVCPGRTHTHTFQPAKPETRTRRMPRLHFQESPCLINVRCAVLRDITRPHACAYLFAFGF